MIGKIIAAPFNFIGWCLGLILWPFGKIIELIEWIVGYIAVPFVWVHKRYPTMTVVFLVCLAATYAAALHDPSNHLDFHRGLKGFLWYMAVGLANFLYGVWDSACYFGNEVLAIPSKVNHDPGDIVGIIVETVKAGAHAFVFWGSTYLISKETCWIAFITFAIVVAGGARGGHAAPKPSGGGGH